MDYISRNNPRAAIALDDEFESVAAEACTHPAMHKIGRIAGTREAVVRPSYILLYRFDDEKLEVLRVINTAQKWPPVY